MTQPKQNGLRHPSVQEVLKYLEPNTNLKETQFLIANNCYNLASNMLDKIEDSPELTVGLRKLLEAKDAFVRASLDL